MEPSADLSAVAFLLITKVCRPAAKQPIPRRNSARPAKTMELIIFWNTSGECKHIISGYLKCIKMNKGTNDEACRKLAKEYLSCRMDKYVCPIHRGLNIPIGKGIVHVMSVGTKC